MDYVHYNHLTEGTGLSSTNDLTPYFPKHPTPLTTLFDTTLQPAIHSLLRGENCSAITRSVALARRPSNDIVVHVVTTGPWPKREWYPFPDLGDSIRRSTVEDLVRRLVGDLAGEGVEVVFERVR